MLCSVALIPGLWAEVHGPAFSGLPVMQWRPAAGLRASGWVAGGTRAWEGRQARTGGAGIAERVRVVASEEVWVGAAGGGYMIRWSPPGRWGGRRKLDGPF